MARGEIHGVRVEIMKVEQQSVNDRPEQMRALNHRLSLY